MPTYFHVCLQTFTILSRKLLSAIEATCHATFAQRNNHINLVSSLTISSETVYNPFKEDKLDFKISHQVLFEPTQRVIQPSLPFSPFFFFPFSFFSFFLNMLLSALDSICYPPFLCYPIL